MDLHDAVVDFEATSAFGEDDGVVKVWSSTSSLGVDTNHTKLLPDFLCENFKTKLHGDRNTGIKWLL